MLLLRVWGTLLAYSLYLCLSDGLSSAPHRGINRGVSRPVKVSLGPRDPAPGGLKAQTLVVISDTLEVKKRVPKRVASINSHHQRSNASKKQIYFSAPEKTALRKTNRLPHFFKVIPSLHNGVKNASVSRVSASNGAPQRISVSSPSEINRPKKPVFSDLVRQRLPPFTNYKGNREMCSDVLQEMVKDSVVSGHAYLVFNILAAVDSSSYRETGSKLQSDKEARAAMDELYQASVDTGHFGSVAEGVALQPGGLGILGYFDRLAACDADHAAGRTIYQKLLELGMEQSCRSDFVLSVLSRETESGFKPQFALDKAGNTLLHLAALSGSSPVVDFLIARETTRRDLLETSIPYSGYYWLLGAFHHKNKNGKQPLDLAKTPGLRTRLKRLLRTLIHFFRKVLPATRNAASSRQFQSLLAIVEKPSLI